MTGLLRHFTLAPVYCSTVEAIIILRWATQPALYSVSGRRSCRLTDRRSGSSFHARDFRMPCCLSRMTYFCTGHGSPESEVNDGATQRRVTLCRDIQIATARLIELHSKYRRAQKTKHATTVETKIATTLVRLTSIMLTNVDILSSNVRLSNKFAKILLTYLKDVAIVPCDTNGLTAFAETNGQINSCIIMRITRLIKLYFSLNDNDSGVQQVYIYYPSLLIIQLNQNNEHTCRIIYSFNYFSIILSYHQDVVYI